MSTPRDLLRARFTSWARVASRAAARTPWRLALFAVVALAASWTLLSTAPLLNDFRDAHVLSHYEQSAADAVLRHHQAPLWDPYYCGGMYLLGTPQARFASPTFLLTLLFGEPRGEALTAFFMMLLGLEGAYRYARARRALATGAVLAAPVFALSGVFAVAPALGWTNFFGFELLPWIALGTHQALRGSRRGLLVAAVSVAWCVGFGGTYAVPLAALWCAMEALEATLTRLVRARRARALSSAVVLGRAAAIAFFAAALSAFRLWPVLETLEDAPRIIGGAPGTSIADIGRMLFAGVAPKTEDGTYLIGAFALLAVALGSLRLRSLPLLAQGATWLWLAGGAAFQPSLFLLLRKLPVYATLRYPERCLILLALVASVLAARGITTVEAIARARRSSSRRLVTPAWIAWATAGAFCVAGVVPLAVNHARTAAQRALFSPPAVTEQPFHQARGNRWALAYYEPMQRGSLSCWDAYPVPQSPRLRGDLTAEEHLLDPTAGEAKERRWSPNRIDVDVELAKPGTLLVNQNWHRGWHASTGQVRDHEGLLAVDLPAGKHAVALTFAPRSATGGALVSIVTLVALAVLTRLPRRRPPGPLAFAIGAASPLLALGAVLLFVHEARGEPRIPRTPHGDPVVTDTLDAGAIRIAARFEGGVTLEATSVSDASPRAGDTVDIELDWSRAPRIPRGLGVFVHITPSAGEGMNGDHATFSGVLAIDDAPPNKTLRDVFPLTLPADAGGKRWKIWVGLWRLSGDGTRVRVVEPGSAILSEDRVLAADFVVLPGGVPGARQP